MKKSIYTIVLFCIIACGLIRLSDISLDKKNNRYYMQRQFLNNNIIDEDVLVFGSCHAFTSFDPNEFEEKFSMSSYNLSRPSEIMPATYLTMVEQFKEYKPRIAIIELWGINAYNTYIEKDAIFNEYFPAMIEVMPLSMEKINIINDFESLDLLNENIHLVKYKNRIVENALNKIDFAYDYEEAKELYGLNNWIYEEMDNRFSHKGYKETESLPLKDYQKKQIDLLDESLVMVEDDMIKYVKKIIDLCRKNNVKIIFYRAPYVSNATEKGKVNYMINYFNEQKIPFYDLEKEIIWDYETDFSDYEHLSKQGAKKATDFLGEKIVNVLDN